MKTNKIEYETQVAIILVVSILAYIFGKMLLK